MPQATGDTSADRPMPSRVRALIELVDRHSTRLVAVLAGLIVLLGAIYSFYLGPELRYWDEREYLALATSLVDQGTYDYTGQRAFRPPLYPMLLAGLLQVGVPVEGLRIANFVLLAGCAILLYRLTVRITNARAAGVLAAAWIVAYPVLLYLAGTLYAQTLAAFLLLLALDLLLQRAPLGVGRATAGGIVYGLLLLAVPTFLALLGVVVVWFLWRQGKRALLPAAVLCGAALVTVAPWTVRNYLLFDRFVFIASNSGLNLLIGNCENTRPELGVATDHAHYVAQTDGMDELARNDFYRDAALTWIRANPGAAARLYAGKLAQHFACDERLATEGAGQRGQALVMVATYLPLLALAGLRFLLWRRRRIDPIEWGLLALYLGHAAASAVFFTRIRFRLPTDLLLMVLAASTMTVLVAARAARQAPAARDPTTALP